jgi:hypothetical protein
MRTEFDALIEYAVFHKLVLPSAGPFCDRLLPPPYQIEMRGEAALQFLGTLGLTSGSIMTNCVIQSAIRRGCPQVL